MKKIKSYYIIVIGCQMNEADGERISGLLTMRGLKPAKQRKLADLVVVVTCGVRQSAENRIFGLLPRIKQENPQTRILFTGCLVYRDDIKRKMGEYVDWWTPVNLISNFEFRISNESRNTISKFKNSPLIKNSKFKIQNYLDILPQYASKFTAFVPIGNGCDNFCAYCVVPYARGREVYRPAAEIIDEVKNLIKSGYKEIFLIAQNVNSYKTTNNKLQISNKFQNPKSKIIGFPKLIKLVNDIPGDFWIRFMTSHPKDMSDELIKTIAKCEKVCEHVHLPAQAGDDAVLKRMNRKYAIQHYKKLVQKIRKNYELRIMNYETNIKSKFKLPAAITTDIIVGFPGETRGQFLNTVKLFNKVKFDMAYIAQYSPRPGTAAFKMKDNVTKTEKKRREDELNKILSKTCLENNIPYLGKEVEVLLSGKNKKGEWMGYTRTLKKVKVKNIKAKTNIDLTGKFVFVKITKVKDFGMEGKMVEVSPPKADPPLAESKN